MNVKLRNGGLVIALIVIAIWIIKIVNGKMPNVDQVTRGMVGDVAGTPVYTLFRWLTELGSVTFVLPLTVIMLPILWGISKDWLPPVTFGIGVLGSHLLNQLIKQLVARGRPSVSALLNAEGYSFPSGHSMVSLVCYGLIAYFIVQHIKGNSTQIAVQISLGILIFLIGISRYIINVHYLTDVLTGFTLGFIWLVCMIYLFKIVQKKRTPSEG